MRYLYDTLHDLAESIRTKWPADRPMPAEVGTHLTFSEFALNRLRNDSGLRKLAEVAER